MKHFDLNMEAKKKADADIPHRLFL